MSQPDISRTLSSSSKLVPNVGTPLRGAVLPSPDVRLVNNRYEIKSKIKRANCTIYFATDVVVRRDVVMKFAQKPRDLTMAVSVMEKLLYEAQQQSRLAGVGGVEVYDFIDTSTGWAIVMPLLKTSLGSVAGKFLEMDVSSILDLLDGVAKCIDTCTEKGFAHRDIKISNIVLGASWTPLLIDFELAADFDSEDAWALQCGTPQYMPPETIKTAEAASKFKTLGSECLSLYRDRHDQFSFGVLTFQMLTGRFPFAGRLERSVRTIFPGAGRAVDTASRTVDPASTNDALAEINSATALQLIRGVALPDIASLNPSAPPEFQMVVKKMLNVNPRDRFENCASATNALRVALAKRPGDGVRVFVSYARDDQSKCHQLKAELEKKGFDVWTDSERILYGESWHNQIEEAMVSADVMVVLLSQSSAKSDEVKNEWGFWLGEMKKPLITIIIDQCRIPYRLHSMQHMNLSVWDPLYVANEIGAAFPKLKERSEMRRRSMPSILPDVVDERYEGKFDGERSPDTIVGAGA